MGPWRSSLLFNSNTELKQNAAWKQGWIWELGAWIWEIRGSGGPEHVEIPSYEVDLKFQRIRGSEGPEHVEIPSYEVDLREERRGKKNILRRPEHVENPSCESYLTKFCSHYKVRLNTTYTADGASRHPRIIPRIFHRRILPRIHPRTKWLRAQAHIFLVFWCCEIGSSDCSWPHDFSTPLQQKLQLFSQDERHVGWSCLSTGDLDCSIPAFLLLCSTEGNEGTKVICFATNLDDKI